MRGPTCGYSIAPPGAGKGTQAALIATHFDIPHVATGDLLRDHVARQTELGRAVQDHLERGELVPDEIVLDMVRAAFVTVSSCVGCSLVPPWKVAPMTPRTSYADGSACTTK